MTTLTAKDLWDVGCSIIPVNLDKRPAWSLLPQKFDETAKRMKGEWKPFQERRPNAGEMTRWSKATPPAFAIVTGEISGRITFDFDGEQGVKLAQSWGIHPHRRTGSGGLHLDVVHPGWFVPTLNGKSKQELGRRWPGLDVKGDGGYVVAIGRNEKGIYEWLRDSEPDPIESVPAEVWGFLKQYSSAKESITQPTNGTHTNGKVRHSDFADQRVASDKLIERALSAAPLAGRNTAGFDLACQARDNGYSESETLGILRTFRNNAAPTNTKGQHEPYSEQEIAASLREAFNRSPRDPWPRSQAPSYTYTHERNLTRPAGLGVNGEPSDNISDGPIDLLRFLMNDQGNSERLRAFAGSGIRYCHDFKKWLIWDGTRWTIDGQDQIFKWAKAAMLEFLRQAIDAKNEPAEKFARQSLDARRLGAMVHLTECELPVSPEELDIDPALLNFRNGTVDLRTGTLKAHSPDDFITKIVEFDYNPEAKCPIFLATLHRLMGGGPDASEEELQRAERLVSHLQKAFGYSATGITSEKVVFVPYGGGNNGKDHDANNHCQVPGRVFGPSSY